MKVAFQRGFPLARTLCFVLYAWCFVPGALFGRFGDLRRNSNVQLKGTTYKAQSKKYKAPVLVPPCHQQPNLLQRRDLRIHLARDSSFVDDEQTIRKTGDLFQLC